MARIWYYVTERDGRWWVSRGTSQELIRLASAETACNYANALARLLHDTYGQRAGVRLLAEGGQWRDYARHG